MTMALRTRLLCALADRRRSGRVRDQTDAARAQGRAAVLPQVFPLDRVFGRVPAGVTATSSTVQLAGRTVGVRRHESAARRRPGPLVLFFHGGGWSQGNVRSYDALCGQMAAAVDALVLSVDYRLAPEHPFPAAVDDCFEVTRWAADQAGELGVDPARIAVAGDSAGGNLAAVVALLARDEGGPALALQALLYPATDATLSSPSIGRNAQAPILTRRDVEDFLELYAGTADATDPRLSPLLARSHAGVAPALIQTAELDPLRDDGGRYATALREAGVAVRWTDYVGAPHGFASFPGALPAGRQALAELLTALREALA